VWAGEHSWKVKAACGTRHLRKGGQAILIKHDFKEFSDGVRVGQTRTRADGIGSLGEGNMPDTAQGSGNGSEDEKRK
jgi:hypothetical protein